MVAPLLPLAAFAAMALADRLTQIGIDYGRTQEYKQRIQDWHKNVPNSEIKYPITRGLEGSLFSSGMNTLKSIGGLYQTVSDIKRWL